MATGKGRTKALPGMEAPEIEELNQLADAFKQAGRALRKQQTVVGERHAELLAGMKKHAKTLYVDHEHGYKVRRVAGEERVKVGKLKEKATKAKK